MPIEWKALYIDDDIVYAKGIKDELNGVKVLEPDHILSIKTIEHFDDAIPELENKRYDLVIIDLRLGDTLTEVAEEEGIKTLESIQSRIFLPIIFFTVIPKKLEGLSSQLIRVVDKKDGPDKLLEEIMDIFNKRLPIVNRALIKHVEEVQRNYMWNFVAQNWDEFGSSVDKAELAILLARRLSVTLCRENIGKLVSEIDSGMHYRYELGRAHPVEYYLRPPIENEFRTGDIFTKVEGDGKRYQILLNPCCDFEHNNVELALFANCSPLEEQSEYVDLKSDLKNVDKKGKVKSLIKDRRDGKQSERFFFLPKAFSIPDLVVDFQRLTTIELSELKENGIYIRVASLDSPFAEALLNKFSHYYGRIGKPDIQDELVMERIMKNIEAP
jgi:DNA-binding NarL/FixJ family response regulator